MAGGDSFRRVQTGDRMTIQPDAWNALMDLTQHTREGQPGAKARPLKGALRAGEVVARNVHAEKAPWRGICELCAVGDSVAQVEITKPGDAAGVGVYGILTTPIKSGSYGRVALSGGPWEVTCAGVVPGDNIGPRDGNWVGVAEEDASEVILSVARGTLDGVVVCFFSDHNTPDALTAYYPATYKMVEAGTPPACGDVCSRYDPGTATETGSRFALFRYASPLTARMLKVAGGVVPYFAHPPRPSYGPLVAIFASSWATGGMVAQESVWGEATAYIIKEAFDLADVSAWADVLALTTESVGVGQPSATAYWAPGATADYLYVRAGGGSVYSKTWALTRVRLFSPIPIYGFALRVVAGGYYSDYVDACLGNIYTGLDYSALDHATYWPRIIVDPSDAIVDGKEQ